MKGVLLKMLLFVVTGAALCAGTHCTNESEPDPSPAAFNSNMPRAAADSGEQNANDQGGDFATWNMAQGGEDSVAIAGRGGLYCDGVLLNGARLKENDDYTVQGEGSSRMTVKLLRPHAPLPPGTQVVVEGHGDNSNPKVKSELVDRN